MSRESVYVIYELLKSINKTIHREVGKKLGFKNANPSVMAIMFFLKDGEAKTLKEIASCVGLANSTVSGIIERLVNEGYVKRIQDREDRRKVLISITDKAKEMHRAVENEYKDYIEGILKNANEDDIEIVISGLIRLNEILKESERV